MTHDTSPTCEEVLRAPIDPISATLMEISLDNVLCCRSELTAPWGLSIPVEPGQLMFHIPISNRCLLGADGHEHDIGPGHFALITKPGVHTLRSAPEAEAVDVYALPTTVVSDRMEVLEYGGGGDHTTLVCGVAKLEHPLARLVLDALPDAIYTESEGLEGKDMLTSALRRLSFEATHVTVGGAAVVNLLANLLVIEGVRTWLDAQADDTLPQWFGALRHPRIGAVLTALHAEPGAPWTVDRMAAMTAMSKSSFHTLFRDTVGMTPSNYVLHWRMRYAASRLATSTDTVAEIAYACGYDSESAFSRAFRREIGHSPKQERHRAEPRAAAGV